jgi:signal transduction histidine kinase
MARVVDELFWRKDGTCFPVEYWSYPMLEGGVQIGAVVGFIDISARAALEQQLRQSQKLEAIGRLAGGIAHDFNNMLTAIVGHASVARELTDGSPVRQDLDEVLAAAEKAAGLTRQILAFSRKQPMKLAPSDVNEIVLGMGKVLSRVLGEDVDVTYRLSGGALVAQADRAQIEQVLLNLWTNARDAMPAGGRLTIATQAVTCDAEGAAALGLDGPGRYALITVTDSGVGMDERTRQQAFEPFFTTKEPGKGTGLGLSIVYGIVKQHRGQIAVASVPGQGLTDPLISEGQVLEIRDRGDHAAAS